MPVLSDEAYQLKSTFEPESSLFEDLNSYAAVIFNNISKTQIPPDSLSKISSYVRRGGAFVMVGGERSFGLGEYRDSPIEEILPVRLLPPQSKQKRLTIAVELVIDKSKSMVEDQRLEFVKDAAREVIRNLKDDDLVGITAFDTMPFIAVPLGAVGQIKQMAMDRISILFPTGKTNLLPAMAQARQALENAQSGRKHMIILTDGDLPDSGPHYTELVRQMRFSGITVSTVLIGTEFDRTLRQMADVGGGAFYNTRDPQALPKIFLRDIKVRSGEETMKEQQEFEVRKGPGSLESTSLRSFPSLYGFVQTQIKENANLELVIRSSTDSQTYPLLSSWNVDKGKVIAFTSDANGRWSREWIGWPNFRKFWDDLLSSARPSLKEHTESIKFDLRYYLEGASLVLDLTFISPMQGKKLNSELILPDTSKRNLEFQNIAKNRFRSELRDPLPGKYEFTGNIGDKKLTPIAFNLSGELFGEKKERRFNIPLLEELASINGAKTNPEYSEILAKQSEKIEKLDLSTHLILLAFLLLMLEIASRELLQKTQKSKTRRASPLTPRGIRQLLHPFTKNRSI
ncbi:MAG: VWA domain-containing protein [SAR324 cluster bacterium]|uniref:VWA domain-containing protein n=1 Tax=SAR324 cluster bacterium TaxID=2024889 RepID=A0A7X9IM04_9DELT|nr:VWA domain-containing protein [SAR324 cluster bacterium]